MADTKTTRSAETEEELRRLLTELAEVEGGIADEGKAAECLDRDERATGILQRIREITGE